MGLAHAVETELRPSPGYKESLGWLYATQQFGIKLGLENIQRLLQELGLPGKDGRILHVAGTNGKGSVCAMIEAICRTHGYRTGLFTSPHLITYRERIRVKGELISEEKVARGLTIIRELVSEWETHPTFFEITTALALLHFKECACDLIILETGLGGRLDATNALEPVVSVITPIGLDHQSWLGNTLEKIAGEKAGIIKPQVPVVSAVQEPMAEEVIRDRATACEAAFRIVRQPYTATSLGLAGAYQQQNAALAIAALEAGGIAIAEEAVANGLARVDWPARFQRWDNRTIIDGAHNPSGAGVLAQTWREQFGDERATVIIAVLRDKDIAGIWRALAPIACRVLCPKVRSERALAPEAFAKTIHEISPQLPCSIGGSIAAAFAQARSEASPILITGSLHFAGEVLATLRGEPALFEECAQ
jgi:dihydrofolate synthase/folylpolyglutamate synthase